jgi:hypothetical protein
MKCPLLVSRFEGIFLKRTEQNYSTNLVYPFSSELDSVQINGITYAGGVSSFLVSSRCLVIRLT